MANKFASWGVAAAVVVGGGYYAMNRPGTDAEPTFTDALSYLSYTGKLFADAAPLQDNMTKNVEACVQRKASACNKIKENADAASAIFNKITDVAKKGCEVAKWETLLKAKEPFAKTRQRTQDDLCVQTPETANISRTIIKGATNALGL